MIRLDIWYTWYTVPEMKVHHSPVLYAAETAGGDTKMGGPVFVSTVTRHIRKSLAKAPRA